MDQYLKNLLHQGLIDYEEALAHCSSPEEFEKRV